MLGRSEVKKDLVTRELMKQEFGCTIKKYGERLEERLNEGLRRVHPGPEVPFLAVPAAMYLTDRSEDACFGVYVLERLQGLLFPLLKKGYYCASRIEGRTVVRDHALNAFLDGALRAEGFQAIPAPTGSSERALVVLATCPQSLKASEHTNAV